MRRRFTGQADDTEVNVTPLLDIVFIMLIFFIVTATFVYEDGIAPNTPEDSPDEPTNPPPSLLLYVQQDGFVSVDDARIIDPQSTRPVVEEFFASNPEGVVIVSAAPQSRSGVAIEVLDQARIAGNSVGSDKITITKSNE